MKYPDANAKAAQEAADLTQRALMALKGNNQLQDHIAVGMHAAIGALQVCCTLLSRERENITKKMTEEQFRSMSRSEMLRMQGRLVTGDVMLFAALLAYCIAPQVDPDGHTESRFGPEIYVKALDMFEKLTGRKPDEALCEGFTEKARKLAAEEAEAANSPFAAFMTKRKEQGQPSAE